MRTVVVGVGNPILGDDGVGIHIALELMKQDLPPDVDIEEASTGGLNLLDVITGYDRAIIVDAVLKEDMDLGEVGRFDMEDLGSVHSCNPHDVSFPQAIELASRMGDEDIPDEIILIGIKIEEYTTFSDKLSYEVLKSVPIALKMIKEEIGR